VSLQAIYHDMDAFMADVVEITRIIIRQPIEAGCRYIQIDAPVTPPVSIRVSLDRNALRGEDPDAPQRLIAADNAVIEGFDGVTFGIHLARAMPARSTPRPATSRHNGIAKGTTTALLSRCSHSWHHRFC
jgi:5-methyltetrahydropteroyltriglutamate--homocysteine methyltransferase